MAFTRIWVRYKGRRTNSRRPSVPKSIKNSAPWSKTASASTSLASMMSIRGKPPDPVSKKSWRQTMPSNFPINRAIWTRYTWTAEQPLTKAISSSWPSWVASIAVRSGTRCPISLIGPWSSHYPHIQSEVRKASTRPDCITSWARWSHLRRWEKSTSSRRTSCRSSTMWTVKKKSNARRCSASPWWTSFVSSTRSSRRRSISIRMKCIVRVPYLRGILHRTRIKRRRWVQATLGKTKRLQVSNTSTFTSWRCTLLQTQSHRKVTLRETKVHQTLNPN